MSMTEATRIRLPHIKAGLMTGKTYEQIGEQCGVTLKTIYRDVQVWTQTSDFDEWLDAEWVRLKAKTEQEDFIEVFRQLTKLKVKRIAQKIIARSEHREVHEDVKRIEIVQLMETYGGAVESAIQRNIQSLTKDAHTQPVDTSHANAETS